MHTSKIGIDESGMYSRILTFPLQLINTQEELGKCKTELKQKSDKLQGSEKAAKDLENEVRSLMEQIGEQTTRK